MKSKKELIEQAYNLAYKYEAERGSCPQCVLAAIMETIGVGDPDTIKAVDALAGGTALSTNGTCGALIGGLAAISSIVGRDYKSFSTGDRKRRVFQYSKKLYDKFVKEYGSPVCKDVHIKLFGRTFNLLDPKDYEEFEKAGAHVDKCPSVSGNVAKWTAEIILNELKT
ncbi:MAG: C-GCAxxG-C-C family protein [Candidatus Thermoplasmatota archaeon]|jgi:C_GCAxxG_C_C family probable redox protein|nr:C-GCAxxG-C-C family protein [Candidatus Thermoplasmatota archaeon]